MPRLHPAPTPGAPADRHLEPGGQRCRLRQLLDMLHSDPFHQQFAPAPRAPSRQLDRDHPVRPCRRSPVPPSPVRRTRPTPGTLRVRRGVTLGQRGGLPLGRPAQRLDLAPQPLVGLPEAFTLALKAIVLAAQPLTFSLKPPPLGLQPLLLLTQRGVLVLQPRQPHEQLSTAAQVPADP
jgi:hypothetical protein